MTIQNQSPAFHTDAIRGYLADPRIYLTDGGFETSMLFLEGFDLPAFAACVLLEDEAACAAMDRYFDRYLAMAETAGTGFVLDTNTWRSGTHWAEAVGRSPDQMQDLTREAVRFAMAIRARWQDRVSPILVNGVIGPAGDAYDGSLTLDAATAEAIHAPQIALLGSCGVDLVSALTFGSLSEAIGFTRAGVKAGVPVVISYTVETDGRLPDGTPLERAVLEADAATEQAPLYYMINCAHPEHFRDVLNNQAWCRRIRGVRANASRLSHAELDAAETLDDGDPEEFGTLHAALSQKFPALKVVGGCCGTDHRHVGCMANAMLPSTAA
ncbi:homocysteine S-methyltransferase family protein [Sulfitobacter sp. SK011]|uniref:homocysteine S-methyltransferase family protein n=1 Tax=Sulfitobacter sp. SK011 TaxID=1389004 RepID=UPI000E0C00BA|nr:homocysteine S-methyltransferase family protein [Sulfitobacter sp. SK011]AXI42632.1 homocysteine S-methyltransferase [Sulfitobacter sp. SK011]